MPLKEQTREEVLKKALEDATKWFTYITDEERKSPKYIYSETRDMAVERIYKKYAKLILRK